MLQNASLQLEAWRPIIFLNACRSGVGGTSIMGSSGLAQAFVSRGAGLFVGTLWSIGDKTALTFASAFYERLRAGDSVTAAARCAREAAKGAREMTWLAYTIFGHPDARLSEDA